MSIAWRRGLPPRPDVLLVAQHHAPELVGSAFYTHDLAKALAARGLRVEVVAGEPKYPHYRRFPGYERHVRVEQIDDITVHRVREIVPRAGSAAWRAAADLHFAARGMATRARLPRAPLVLSFSPGFPAVRLGRSLTVPGGHHVCVLHDLTSGLASSTGMATGPRAAAVARLEARWLDTADVVAVLSRQMADAVRAIGVSTRVEVVPLWLRDLDWEAPIDPPQADPRLVLYSGVLAAKQGIDQLLELADGLSHRPDVRVRIQGDGPARADLEDGARERGLDNIEFRAFVPPQDLARSLREASVLVVPQDPSGAAFSVPSKALGALASGRPVVATARPGTPLADLAEDFPGMSVVPPHDPAAFAATVEAHLDRPATAAIDQVARVRGRFSREAVVDRLLALGLPTSTEVPA